MGYQPLEDLLPRAANYSIYRLVRLASKRALELSEQGVNLVGAPLEQKLTTTALEEIKQGRVIDKVLADQQDEARKKEEIMTQKGLKIVLGVTGSIAAYKAADLIRRFQEQGADVTVVMTKEAEEFVTPLTLATLSGKDVFTDMFAQNNWRMGHIELAKADAVVIAPATANIIAKAAHGLADDFLSTLIISTKSPIFIAPAMNEDMYRNAMVAENCAKLKKHGIKFIEPVKGKLACGIVGVGHLAEAQDIVKIVLKNA